MTGVNMFLLSDDYKRELYAHCHKAYPADLPLTVSALPEVEKRNMLGQILENKIEEGEQLHDMLSELEPAQIFGLIGEIYLRLSYMALVNKALEIFELHIDAELQDFYLGMNDE